MSLAEYTSTAPVDVVLCRTVTVVVVEDVWRSVKSATLAAAAVMSFTRQFHPVGAVKFIAITPPVAAPPVPTLTRNEATLPAVTDGPVPNPDEMVGVALL